MVAWGGRHGSCVAWDVKTAKIRAVFEKAPGGPGANHGAVSADGRRIATVHDGGGCPTLVRVWDAATGTQLWELNYADGQEIVHEFAFSPDGKRLAAGTQGGAAEVYDAEGEDPDGNVSPSTGESHASQPDSPSSPRTPGDLEAPPSVQQPGATNPPVEPMPVAPPMPPAEEPEEPQP